MSSPNSKKHAALCRATAGLRPHLGSLDSASGLKPRRERKTSTHDVVVLGDKSVGKSAIVVQLLSHRFIYEYDSSTDSLYGKRLALGDRSSQLSILDVAAKSPEETCDVLDHSNISGIVLVYSITDPDSLDHAKKLKSLIDSWMLTHRLARKVPVVLVGNKVDLQPQRAVTSSQGFQAAAELDFQAFHEVSAATGRTEVEQVFIDLLQHMRTAKKEAAKAAKLEAKRYQRLSKSSDNLDEIGSSSWQQHHDTNTLKKVVLALKHFQFTSSPPSPGSPTSSRRSSPRPSPRSSRILSTAELAVAY